MVTLQGGLRILVGDGSLLVFRHEVPITFEDNADGWLLDGLFNGSIMLICSCKLIVVPVVLHEFFLKLT